MWSSARSEAQLEAALPLPIDIRPLKSARRLRLRFDEAAGVLKLTCPLRTSRRAAILEDFRTSGHILDLFKRGVEELGLTIGAQ